MRVFAVDPGPARSAWLLFDGSQVVESAIDTNEEYDVLSIGSLPVTKAYAGGSSLGGAIHRVATGGW